MRTTYNLEADAEKRARGPWAEKKRLPSIADKGGTGPTFLV